LGYPEWICEVNAKMKLNFMKIKNNIFRHRQIERRNNLLFMRMKQRSLLIVRRVENEQC